MKKLYIVICFFALKTNLTFSQTDQVFIDKSFWGAQIGFPGAWVYNESKIGSKFALRSEAGFDMGIWGGDFYDNTGFLLTPVITAEPRFYYNLNKRKDRQKYIAENNGNFIALRAAYHPDWFVISNHKSVKIVQDISVIPTWGIRRTISKSNFNYEVGGGIGYRYVFAKHAGYLKDEGNAAVNLHLRIGYTF